MDLKSFADVITCELQKKLGKDFEVSIDTTLKNNSIEKLGIMVRRKNDRISPTVYIDDLLDDYNEHQLELKDIVENVYERYEYSVKKAAGLYELNMHLEECGDKVIFRLISVERNKQLLKNTPYIPFLDLAITFHIIVNITEQYMQTIRITDEMLSRLNLSLGQLFKMARENTERLLPPDVCSLTEIVNNYIDADEKELTKDEKPDMIVVTNHLGVNGAAVILYDGMVEKLAEEYQSDLYVVPSSIHEMIVVPVREDEPYELLSFIIKKINRQFVKTEEVLSDRIYTYVKDEKKFI